MRSAVIHDSGDCENRKTCDERVTHVVNFWPPLVMKSQLKYLYKNFSTISNYDRDYTYFLKKYRTYIFAGENLNSVKSEQVRFSRKNIKKKKNLSLEIPCWH